MYNYLRFRYRRLLRRLRRDFRTLRKWVVNYIERHIWGKWHQLRVVRRFLIIWWLIPIIALIGMVQQISTLQQTGGWLVATPGGTYSEAAVGTVKSLNPVLPESATASDINRLIFSGLTRYNAKRQLVPDLATWEASADAKTYTFHLRHDIKWHDDVPFTSADVAFTLLAIQNPDSRSPLASSWQDVKIDTPDDYTVVFQLPQPLSSFLDSTTMGIIPRHLLESVEPSQLREAEFNQHPVGTGPFKMKSFAPSANEIELSANPNYHFGRPKLDQFNFKFYPTADAALRAYAQHQVISPGRIRPETAASANQQAHLSTYEFTLPEEEILFFSTTDPMLSDQNLRSILSRSLDRAAILETAAADQGVVTTQPLLPGQIGYTNKYVPESLSPAAATAALDQAGWTREGAGVRAKAGTKLTFQLVTQSGGELERAATEIKRQWSQLGIGVNVVLADKSELQQTYMRPRNFQILLYGVNLGADPDVYSFWHSSQAKDPGVNLSGFNSTESDRALEAGRIKTETIVRAGKYDTFLRVWNAATPAAVLYQSGYVYAARDDVAGIISHRLVVPADRYYGVERWTVRRQFAPAR
jgi:peptide/nickel transport system substrate-binding protein